MPTHFRFADLDRIISEPTLRVLIDLYVASILSSTGVALPNGPLRAVFIDKIVQPALDILLANRRKRVTGAKSKTFYQVLDKSVVSIPHSKTHRKLKTLSTASFDYNQYRNSISFLSSYPIIYETIVVLLSLYSFAFTHHRTIGTHSHPITLNQNLPTARVVDHNGKINLILYLTSISYLI